ncbi:putative C2H2 finger domain protein [Aspergillus udagawae]|uniref:Putative C2H2 finger domain protein n=1 Tax=Aspergillus udagawae TaxID=91492 RepID=A0A8H3SG37_9EURO|nr:uncharacterized protein Aud_002848 [Aspergillus udagawae]GFF26773.1 putative C2H2 finger domain protein [Aspergillus udagawae]GFF59197.1 putative C2H2 finger domain protein [Aspergillus udagawae]GIC86474.1 hypothetical protein Aud_002848 [Aspergillus udagawae]
MGQSQSTNFRDDAYSAEPSSKERKEDYYELLGIQHDASTDEIRRAYKRKALELHPDRNYGNVEAATKLFAEIQTAYQVLSDPQERAWYDTHKDAFLSGDGQPSSSEYCYDSRMTTSGDILKLFSKFSPRMEFSDSPSGFFGGLRAVFTRLALEEEMACRADKLEFVDYPTFGSQSDTFEDVVRPFYAVWCSFSTKKSFAWKDIYRYSEAPDRRVRRLMEKENKRLREEGIREFNEAVRSLVAFVKKRDPRYKSGIQSEAQRRELLRQTAAAQAAKSRAVNQAKLREHVIPHWAKSEEAEEENPDSSGSELEQFECIICRKAFKSLNQFNAHERSKKHVKAVKQLRWEMRAENESLKLDQYMAPYSDHAPPEQCNDDSAASFFSHEESGKVQDGGNADGDQSIAPIMEDTQEGSRREFTEADTIFPVTHASHESSETILNPTGSDDVSERTDDAVDLLSQRLSASGLGQSPSIDIKKIGKAKQKRARKAAQQALGHSPEVICTTCNTAFPSKTQLFTHLRKYDHAQPPVR